MIYVLWTAAIFLSFFLQGRIAVLGIQPDLTALLAYYVGIRYGETRGLMAGAFIGCLQDILAHSIIGPNLLAKAVVGFSASFFIAGGLFRWTPVLGIIGLFLLTSLDNTIVFVSRSLFDVMPTSPSSALFLIMTQSVMNAGAGILIRPKNVE